MTVQVQGFNGFFEQEGQNGEQIGFCSLDDLGTFNDGSIEGEIDSGLFGELNSDVYNLNGKLRDSGFGNIDDDLGNIDLGNTNLNNDELNSDFYNKFNDSNFGKFETNFNTTNKFDQMGLNVGLLNSQQQNDLLFENDKKLLESPSSQVTVSLNSIMRNEDAGTNITVKIEPAVVQPVKRCSKRISRSSSRSSRSSRTSSTTRKRSTSRKRTLTKPTRKITRRKIKAEKTRGKKRKLETNDDDNKSKVLLKRERNKQSASKYRKKRKIYLSTLETKCGELSTKISDQSSEIKSLSNENKILKEQIAFLKKLVKGPNGAAGLMFVFLFAVCVPFFSSTLFNYHEIPQSGAPQGRTLLQTTSTTNHLVRTTFMATIVTLLIVGLYAVIKGIFGGSSSTTKKNINKFA